MVRAWIVLIAIAGTAAAGELDEAQRKIEDIDYEGARVILEAALERGGMSREELARAERLAGEVTAALGEDDEAEAHFARWIVLEPGATLPEGSSPKIVGPFEAARDRVSGVLEIDVAVARQGEVAVIEVGGADPLAMIAGFRAEAGDLVVAERRRGELLIGPGAATVAVVVLDGNDNVLAREVVSIEAVVVDEAPAPPRGWPAAVRWPTWAGVTVVGLGVAGVFTYRVGEDEDELAEIRANPGAYSVEEAEAVEARGERDALLANVGFAVAGAAAVAAVLTFVLEPDRDVEVAPVAAPGGAGVSATLRF